MAKAEIKTPIATNKSKTATTNKKSNNPSTGEIVILNPPISLGIERIKPVKETIPEAIAVVDKDKILPATNSLRLIGGLMTLYLFATAP